MFCPMHCPFDDMRGILLQLNDEITDAVEAKRSNQVKILMFMVMIKLLGCIML